MREWKDSRGNLFLLVSYVPAKFVPAGFVLTIFI